MGRTNERQAILDALKGRDKPLNAQEVSDVLGKNYESVRQILTRM